MEQSTNEQQRFYIYWSKKVNSTILMKTKLELAQAVTHAARDQGNNMSDPKQFIQSKNQ